MSSYNLLVSWESKLTDVQPVLGEAYYYTCKVNSINPNDHSPGILGIDSFYIVDYVGKIYEITEIIDAPTGEVKIYDLIEDEINGPYINESSYIYQTRSGSNVLTQAQRKRLAPTAYDMILNIENNVIQGELYPDFIQFNTIYTPSSEPEGLVWWNNAEKTLNVSTGIGPVGQILFEDWFWVYNNTIVDIEDGKVIHPVGGVTAGRPHVEKAIADTHQGFNRTIWVTTMLIPAGTAGIATKRGTVHGINTNSFTVGDNIWLSADIAGELVNIKPEFPNYSIQIGGIAVKGILDGELIVSIKGEAMDTIENSWNGTFRESFDFRTSSDGVTITGTLIPSNGHPDMTMMFSDGFTIFDTSPAAIITLTPGTDTIPQTNFVYIPKSTKVLTVSTSDWPNITEHIKVAQIFLQSASTTQEEGALRNQNWNDHIADTNTYQGHNSHITEKLRQLPAQWDSGCEGSVTDIGGDVYVKNTTGIVYQMHRQIFPAQDMTQYNIDSVNQGNKTFTISDDGDLSSTYTDDKVISLHGSTGNDGLYTIVSTVWSDPDFVITIEESIPSAIADGTIGDDIHIINHDTTPYLELTNLSDLTNDASGGTLNNTSFSIVVWGVNNKSGEPTHLMGNLPLSTYNKNFPDQAVIDANAATVYDIPKAFQGVGFLIVRFTFINTGGVWSLYETQDLRGFVPNSTAGTGAGASGITAFLGLIDTPNAYTLQALKIPQINSEETALEFIAPTWTKTGSHIYYNIGNVGIGTTNPQAKLHVEVTGGLEATRISSTNAEGAYLGFIETNESNKLWKIGTDGESTASGDFQFIQNGNTHMVISHTTGNVGIGISTPLSKLHINGTGRITGNLLLDSNFGFSTAGITTIDRILDEDNMVSDSAVALATQQSIKAYIDASGGSSPLTTKGDLYTYSTVDARLSVGTNGQILSADSSESTGLKWTDPTSYTFSNGLTEIAGVVKLGGYTSEHTKIYTDVSNLSYLGLFQTGTIELWGETANSWTQIISQPHETASTVKAVISASYGTGASSIYAKGESEIDLFIIHNISNNYHIKFDETGLYSDTDFSGTYTNKHFIDKGYVDGKLSDTVYGGSWNGITAIAPSKNAVYDKFVINDAAITLNTAKITNATHTGHVTGSNALIIANTVITEAMMNISNAPTNDYVLTADSGETGGWKWAAASVGVTIGNTGEIPFSDTGTPGTDFDYDSKFAWDGTRLNITKIIGNTYVGQFSGGGTGYYNTTFGNICGSSFTSASHNTLMGYHSGQSTTEGSYNSFFGENSGGANIVGDYNSYFGYNCGINVVGDRNVFYGSYAGYHETGSNKLYIDNQNRGSIGSGVTDSLIYGVFNSTVASQELHLNAGIIMIDDIPTTNPSNTGQLWNDGGILKVSA